MSLLPTSGLLALFACAVVLAAAAELKAEDDNLWAQVARSDIVAIGEIGFGGLKGTDEYVVLEFTAHTILKSRVPTQKILKIRFFDRKEEHSDTIEFLKQAAPKPVVIFLVQIDDSTVGDLYLIGELKESIRETSPTIDAVVNRELELQERIAREFKVDTSLPHFAEVEVILASIKDADSQRKAFASLEALGQQGVSAIIHQMHDFRELPDSAISLTNPPGHWESVRHYGPDKVVDALAAILNQITSHHFRTIVNGGSDRERWACINAWRAYLHHIQ